MYLKLVDIDLDYDNHRFEAGVILTVGAALGEIPEATAKALFDAGHCEPIEEPTASQIEAADKVVAKAAAAMAPPEKPTRNRRPAKPAADAGGQTDPGT